MAPAHTHRADWPGAALVAWLVLAAALVLASATAPAHAAKVYFGTQEQLHRIQDVEVKGPNGEALYLGYKTARHAFILPYVLIDEGYVLAVRGRDSYFKLDAAAIGDLQGKGLLPSPLPRYDIDAIEYVFGHVAWIVLGFIGLSIFYGVYKNRRGAGADALMASAQAHLSEGKIDEAIAAYSKALKLAPQNAMALHNRGCAWERKGEFDKAIADHSAVIRLAPKESEAYLFRAIANQGKGDHDRAIADFTTTLRLSPDHAGAHLGIGMSELARGDCDRAIAACSKAVEIAPEWAAPYHHRAAAYEKKGETYLARADTAKVQEIQDRLAAERAAQNAPGSAQ